MLLGAFAINNFKLFPYIMHHKIQTDDHQNWQAVDYGSLERLNCRKQRY